ncbi:hypothetical protein ACFQ60_44210 [Streptomyces zhihengii]
MTFVAESVTESGAEFARLCRRFVRQVRPGGLLVAAFMAGMPSYRIGRGPVWPAFPVDTEAVREVFAPHTERLRLTRVPKDPTLPEYGDDGMVLLRASRRTEHGPGGGGSPGSVRPRGRTGWGGARTGPVRGCADAVQLQPVRRLRTRPQGVPCCRGGRAPDGWPGPAGLCPVPRASIAGGAWWVARAEFLLGGGGGASQPVGRSWARGR